MSNWSTFDEGRSIGKVGREGAVILRDGEQHPHGGCITLKRGSKYVSILSNIYGWMNHMPFFGTVSGAQREFIGMKPALGSAIKGIALSDSKDIKVCEVISEFVGRSL